MRDTQKVFELGLSAGEMLMCYGAETYRVEETVSRILSLAEHKRIDVISLMTGLYITLTRPDGSCLTCARRIRREGTDLEAIASINAISRSLEAGSMTIDEAAKRLRSIKRSSMPALMENLLLIFTGGAFLLMLKGTPVEFFVALFSGCFLALAQWILPVRVSGRFVANLFQSFLTAIVIGLIKRFLLPEINTEILLTSVLMILFPGTTLTNGIRDIIKADYLSGGGNLLEAIIVAAALAGGAGFGLFLVGVLN